uniref:Sterile alpha motif domain-containing protein 9-like n=1 Tax=Petromyzon marinus TaxID=7757 RepID=S4RZ82_PETMA
QVKALLKYAEADPNIYTPVLLLADDAEYAESLRNLQHSIISELSDVPFDEPLIVMINCMRSQAPEESRKASVFDSVILEHKLSPTEQERFEKKLKVMENDSKECDSFLSFIIIKKFFDTNYIANMVKNMMKGADCNSENGKLISCIALLNSYVKNALPVTRCEVILGISHVKSTFWRKQTLDDGLSKHAKLLLIKCPMDEVNGTYESVRMSHPLVAEQVLKEFETTGGPSRCKIAHDILDEHSLYTDGMGREYLVKNVRSMFITRHRKEQGDETDTLFAPLIEDSGHVVTGMELARNVLLRAAARFPKDAVMAQALARYYSLKEKTFGEAKHWAEIAKSLAKSNSYITDTIGQVYKCELKQTYDLRAIENRGFLLPSDLNKALQLAKRASDFFKEAQELAKKEDDVFNTAGFFGDVEVASYILHLFDLTKLFDKNYEINKKTKVAYLNGRIELSRIPTSDEEVRATLEVIQNNEWYLRELKNRMKISLEFLEDYFWLFKPRYSEKETENRVRHTVLRYYSQYTDAFCSDSLDGDKKLDATKYPRLSSSKNGNNVEEKQNFSFANLVLNCVSPTSKRISPHGKLQLMVKDMLLEIGLEHRFPEPYFLAMLLLWPKADGNRREVRTLASCIEAMKRSCRMKYEFISRKRQFMTNFFLGNGTGLNRIVSRQKIDKTSEMQGTGKSLHQLWLSGDILKVRRVEETLFRVHGSTNDEGNIFLDHKLIVGDDNEAIMIPVRPVNLGQLRKGKSIERVKFFVGFSMDGPIAYDVQSV